MSLRLNAETGSPYTPVSTDPFTEPWRWSELEIAKDQSARALSLGPDDSVWIVTNGNELLNYDGRSSRTFEFVWEDEEVGINLVFVSSSNQVYVSTFLGLFTLQNNNWIRITTHSSQYIQTKALLELSNGTIAYSHTEGISLIRGSSLLQTLLIDEGIQSAAEDDKGNLWLLETKSGDIFHALKEDDFISPRSEWKKIFEGTSLRENSGVIFADSIQQLWYVNSFFQEGVRIYNPLKQQWKSYNMRSFSGNNFNTDILQTHDGKIMITGRSSLNTYDGEKWKIYKQPHYVPSTGRPVISQDSKGFIYILESGINVHRIDYANQHWEGYQNMHFQDESPNGRKWFLSVEGKVMTQGPNQEWTQYGQEDGIIETAMRVKVLSNGDVVCIGNEKNDAALSIYDGERWSKQYHPNFASCFARKSIEELEDGSFLIGGPVSEPNLEIGSGRILKFHKTAEGEYVSELLDPENTPKSAHCIISAVDGRIWTSANQIEIFSENEKLHSFNPPGWAHDWIEHISESPNDDIWVSVWAEGVSRFNHETGWTKYGPESGLPTKTVSYTLPFSEEEVIVSSDSGYFLFDGFHWSQFLTQTTSIARDRGTLRRSKDGSFWMNHTYIDWYYRWRTLSENRVHEDESFYTIRYLPDDGAPQVWIPSQEAEVVAPAKLTVRWVGIDEWSKTPREKLLFSYQIDDGEWSPFKTQTSLELSDLPKGNHRLQVRCRDDEFNINQYPASFDFVVVVPFWKEPWFYLTVFSVLAIIALLIAAVVRLKIKHIAELDELRNRFFTNLSHELRTPLTLMMFSIERLLRKDQQPENKQEISLININANRMLTLVEQLLDFRRTEQGKVSIHPQKIELISFAKGLLSVFEIQALDKQHTLHFESSHLQCSTQLDPDLLQKIVDNLIHNAIKYTPEKGHITLRLAIEQHTETASGILNIKVEDNGIGIHPKEIGHVFEPFYREKNDLSKKGSGIGLALVHDLVQLLGGEISVKSPIHTNKERPGCLFEIAIPLPEIIQLDEAQPVAEVIHNGSDSHLSFNPQEKKTEEEGEQQKIVLIAEDNPEILQQLEQEFRSDYQVVCTENGKAGLEKALEIVPDIIIADVMMPEMDGYEMTNELKHNMQTSHIPVILLTALKSHEHQERGFSSGADDYVSKPVSMQLLHLKVQNQLKTRFHLSEKIRQKYQLTTSIQSIHSQDDDFMQQAIDVVDQNLDNSAFDIDDFAYALNMSRSGLYRKFEAIANVSPATFLKTQRLKRAAQKILESNAPMTEIAFDVGFTDAANFTRSFKKHFGCPPSKYKAMISTKDE